jgi:anhydro-N-acetylmuramic acid kinase
MRVAGIMSGTSLDGIDAAVVEINRGRLEPVAFRTSAYPKSVREAILQVSNRTCHTSQISQLNFELPRLYAAALRKLNVPDVRLIGCHGQTIFHEGSRSTLQIGDGSVLAELTGIPVVSDFRPRDMAAGGQGAPLVPYFDYAMFRHPKRMRVAVNIGGIANITVIPPGARLEDVIAFDTGPGNMVMDQLTGGMDRGGKLGAAGHIDRKLLDALLRDRFYRKAPPKSAGREQYGGDFVARFAGLSLPDAVATAAAQTVATLVRGIALVTGKPDDVIVGGGGARNPHLMAMLAGQLPGSRVTVTNEFGIDSDAKEAIAFALLAHATWHRKPSNVPSATGARHPVILGKISY